MLLKNILGSFYCGEYKCNNLNIYNVCILSDLITDPFPFPGRSTAGNEGRSSQDRNRSEERDCAEAPPAFDDMRLDDPIDQLARAAESPPQEGEINKVFAIFRF